MATPTPITLRGAQALGITAAALTSGMMAGLTIVALPALINAPTPTALKQWTEIYGRGRSLAPFFAGLASLCFGYLTYQARRWPLSTPPPDATLYVLAAALTTAVVPFTVLFMAPTNDALFAKERETRELGAAGKAVEAEKERGAKQLLDWWGTLNLMRAVFPLSGALVGAWASLL